MRTAKNESSSGKKKKRDEISIGFRLTGSDTFKWNASLIEGHELTTNRSRIYDVDDGHC